MQSADEAEADAAFARERERAATLLQSRARGRSTRRKVESLKRHGYSDADAVLALQDRAATVIQKSIRGSFARKLVAQNLLLGALPGQQRGRTPPRVRHQPACYWASRAARTK